jgi:hypothetical protein
MVWTAFPVQADVVRRGCVEEAVLVQYGPPGKSVPMMRNEMVCEEAEFAAFEADCEAPREEGRECPDGKGYEIRYSFIQHAPVRVPRRC